MLYENTRRRHEYREKNHETRECGELRGSAKKTKFQKSEITMEVDGWVQVSLRIFFGENHPKIALNLY